MQLHKSQLTRCQHDFRSRSSIQSISNNSFRYDDSFGLYGLDADGEKVEIEESKVTEAKTTLDTEAAAIAYQSTRQPLYPSLGDFADCNVLE